MTQGSVQATAGVCTVSKIGSANSFLFSVSTGTPTFQAFTDTSCTASASIPGYEAAFGVCQGGLYTITCNTYS